MSWTYTACIVEVSSDETEAISYHIHGDQVDVDVWDKLFDGWIAEQKDITAGFYYVEYGYGSGQDPVTYRTFRIGDPVPPIYDIFPQSEQIIGEHPF